MADQKLLYTIEGNADGLKKAMAESEAAHRKLTDALTRKGVEIAALKAAEESLKKIDAAAAKAKREMDFFRRSAEIAPGGIKAFSKDIDQAGKQLAKLTQQAIAQRASVENLRGAAGNAGAGVVAAQEQLANAQAKQRVALLEAERQTRVNYGNQVLANLRAQAAETERVAAIERRRAADEAAASRAAAANARVRAAAQQAAAQSAQASLRLQSFATSLPRFDLKGNAAARLAEINAAAAKSKQAFDNALASARNFGRGGESAAQGVGGQLKSLALQAVAVGSAIKGISATLAAGIQTQRLDAQFQFATGSPQKAGEELAFVRAEAERLALPLIEASQGFAKLAAATAGTQVAGEQTRQIFTGVASAARALSLPAYQVDRAFLAITQALSKGTLQAEEIRGQLAESIPGAFRILANALGITEEKLNDDMKGGLVDSQTAMVAFAKELERLSQGTLPTATQSFQAQAVRLSNSWFDFKAQLAESGVLDAVGEQVTALTEKLAEMSASGELQDFARNLAQVMGDLARILGTVVRLAIDNRDAIGALAAVYAGFKVAKAAQGMAAFVSATAGATGAITGMAGGLRILLALLGGPVGIAVALATAAAAWLIFRKSASDTLDEIKGKAQKTRQALNESILNFNAGGLSGDAAIAEAAANAARLSKELKAAKAARAELAKQTNSLEKLDAADTGIKQLEADLRRAGLYYGEAVKAKAAADKARPAAATPTIPGKPDKAALTAARQEAAALLKAQEALEKARLDAAAQGLEDNLAARREKLDQARKAELIDEAGFIAAKAALDEEGLRNELAALQAQRDKLRADSTNPAAKGSERTSALAELVTVEARIQSASDKILNLNVAATAELTALGVAKLKSQADFLDGLEQEAYLSGLSNDERETALLLLEAEKLGITDINRLLELQGQIRANANAKQAAEELKRDQDALYDSVQEGVQRAFADGLNAVATGEGGVRGALKNLVDTIRNALSNALAGSLAQSFLGLFGGKAGVLNIAGSLGFGGKKDGSTPTSALYVQDVSAGGLAGAAGGEGGGLFSGLGGMLSSLFSGIKSAFTSLVSGLGNALSGLFGGGGGGGSGQNWIGAIASLFGFADGGWTGPGSKYQPAGIVHADEFVFDKVATNRIGVNVLENMRRLASGRFVSSRPRSGYADGGLVNLPGAAAPVVNSSTRILNFFDLDSAMSDYLKTRGGERAILNIIQRNPGAAGA